MRFALFAIVLALARAGDAIECGPGYFFWMRDGIARCRFCPPGCACPGGVASCVGCSGGTFSAVGGASVCSVCPDGTTSDLVFNVGCDPENYDAVCSNAAGILGYRTCRPDPPPTAVGFVAPNGSLFEPRQYINSQPNAVPLPNVVPPYYDVDHLPMLQQSY